MATIDQAREFARLLEEHEPNIRRAFMASVTDLQANVNWPLLIDALTQNNVDEAIDALNIDPEAFRFYASAMSDAFAASGASTAAIAVTKGWADVGVRFRMSNPRAQDWIALNVGELITGFVQEQVEASRAVILGGYSLGHGPRTIAVDLAGRATGPGGAREGGIIGLDVPRADRFNRVSVGMRTPEGVRSLVIEHQDGSLSLRYKVNKATANRILAAYRAGTAVPYDQRVLSDTQYKNALLKARADTISQTETANAVMAGRDEEWRQLIESGEVDGNNVVKVWRHRRGPTFYHRPDHRAMSGKQVIGIDTPFLFPDGVQKLYAHDPGGGAKHNIRCACDTEYRLME